MHRPLNVTRFLLTTILLSISLPALVSAAPPASHHALRTRHEDDEGMDMGSVDMDMDMDGGHTHAEGENANDDMTPGSSSAISIDTPMDMDMPTSSHASADPAGHQHGSHTAPKVELDDAAIHEWHSFPPSYLAADFRLDQDSAIFGEEFDADWEPETAGGHWGLMVAHVAAMCVAYFGALPITLALRAANHPSHHIGNIVFLVIGALGWVAGTAYKASTPNRYEGSVHGGFGNIVVLLSLALTAIDSLGVFKRAFAMHKSGNLNWSTFIHDVLRSPSDKWLGSGNRYEMVGLVEHEEDEHEHEQEHEGEHEHKHEHDAEHADGRQVVFAIGEEEDDDEHMHHRSLSRNAASNRPRRPSLLIRQWTPPSRTSTGSDGTLHDPPASSSSQSFPHKTTGSPTGTYYVHTREPEVVWPEPREKKLDAARTVELLLTWVRRSQVVVAYVVFLTGIVTYTGMCRAGLINTCAAHLIKGSIFFGYGVLTFARYLGAYADLGWAWNRRPGNARGVSAEMVECSVILAYGVTNTWMERFGSKHGDPYTVKQVQHISIAVMFWFAGLTGILLESRTIRRILSSVLGRRRDATEPPSYMFSFNPLPALVIGVTGLAMAAHHQDYVFQVEIHSLWGTLLAGGSAFRFLTYVFLFLRPPTESTLPSRPPTEVLTAFGWAAGGIVFMLSSEEVAWAAMRAGYDDMMAFLNFTIALTSFVFCWEVIVLAVKGVAVIKGEHRARAEHGEGDEERAQALGR